VRRLLTRWLLVLAAIAIAAGPLAADAHLSLGQGAAEICSASHLGGSSHERSSQHHSDHRHDCCVAIAALDATGTTSFDWQPDWLTFALPALPAGEKAPSVAWQLRPSRAPPSSML
jgi:hypothetical protein